MQVISRMGRLVMRLALGPSSFDTGLLPVAPALQTKLKSLHGGASRNWGLMDEMGSGRVAWCAGAL